MKNPIAVELIATSNCTDENTRHHCKAQNNLNRVVKDENPTRDRDGLPVATPQMNRDANQRVRCKSRKNRSGRSKEVRRVLRVESFLVYWVGGQGREGVRGLGFHHCVAKREGDRQKEEG